MAELRKYGSATTLLFPLIDRDAADFHDAPITFAAGDTKISKDEGAFANTANDPAHEGTGVFSLALTATEMQAARIIVTIRDQSPTKEWEDQAIILSTYGNASAQHAFDLDTAEQDVNLVNWRGSQPAVLTVDTVKSDARRISASAVAANNLELEYVGTGYKSYLRRNTAVAGAASTITLDAGASATDDLYNGLIVAIVSGTGAGQARLITDYVGATNIATVAPNWTMNPDATSVFLLLAAGRVDIELWHGLSPNALISGCPDVRTNSMGLAVQDAIADEVWDEAKAGHVAAGSMGEEVQDHALSSEVATVQADTDNIQTRLPAALVGGRMDSSVGAMAANVLTVAATASAWFSEAADRLLDRPISNVEPGAVFRTLYGAISSLVNRRRINAGNIEVFKTDDATNLASLAITEDPAQSPISELDP